MLNQQTKDVCSPSVIEAKPYHSDILPETKALLLEQISILKPNIVHYLELPVITPYSLSLFFDESLKKGAQFDKWGIIIDLTPIINRPDAESRRTIKRQFTTLAKAVVHISYIVDSFFLKTALKFVMHGLDDISYSVSKTEEEAIEILEAKLNE